MVSKWQAEKSLSQLEDYPPHQGGDTMEKVGNNKPKV